MAMIRVEEAAKRAGVMPVTIYRWLSQGRIDGKHGRMMVNARSLQRYLSKRRVRKTKAIVIAE